MMKFGIAVFLSALASLLLPLAYAKDNAAPAPAAQAATVGAPARGALYRVQHRGKTSYLFGTIHVGTPDFTPLGAEVAQALAQSAKLVLEMDVRNEAPLHDALEKYGLYANGGGIERHVAADTLALLQQGLDGFNIPLANVRRMKPWLLANLLVGLDLDRHGFQRRHGAEYVLLEAAAGKQVIQLETAEYQMSLFDSMNGALQEEYLREALAELSDGSAMDKARALIDAWASADRDKLAKIWQQSRADPSRSSEFTHRVLLEQRNPEMASKVEALLGEGDSSFVGVGLLHLIGESGLPALLRQRGYLVERVY